MRICGCHLVQLATCCCALSAGCAAECGADKPRSSYGWVRGSCTGVEEMSLAAEVVTNGPALAGSMIPLCHASQLRNSNTAETDT